MNWKGLGRKHSWPNQGIIPAFVWRDWGKPQQCPASVSNTYMHTCKLSLKVIPLHQSLLLMTWQFVKANTICQTEVPVSLDIWVTNTPFVKMLYPKKKKSLYFCQNATCVSVGLLMIHQVSYVSCKIVYWWITTNCYCMSFMMA